MGWNHHCIDIDANFAFSLQRVQASTQLISLEHVLTVFKKQFILHLFYCIKLRISENLHSCILTGWFILMQVSVWMLHRWLMSIIFKMV